MTLVLMDDMHPPVHRNQSVRKGGESEEEDNEDRNIKERPLKEENMGQPTVLIGGAHSVQSSAMLDEDVLPLHETVMSRSASVWNEGSASDHRRVNFMQPIHDQGSRTPMPHPPASKRDPFDTLEPRPIRSQSSVVVDRVNLEESFPDNQKRQETESFLKAVFSNTPASEFLDHQDKKDSKMSSKEISELEMELPQEYQDLLTSSLLPDDDDGHRAAGEYPIVNWSNTWSRPTGTSLPNITELEHTYGLSRVAPTDHLDNLKKRKSFPSMDHAVHTSTSKTPKRIKYASINDLDSLHHDSEGDGSVTFRSYQEATWNGRYSRLKEHYERTGSTDVSEFESADLSQWIKRQRYQYKLKESGKRSTLTDERQQLLEQIGFIWNAHDEAWQRNLRDLVDYRKVHGHCNVPNNYPDLPSLGVWVKAQRHHYRKYMRGDRSTMTPDRIETLNALGFVWKIVTSQRRPGTKSPPSPSPSS